MKKYRFYGGLFIPLLLITTICSYFTNKIKNTKDHSPPLTQAQLLAIHTTPDKKSSPLLRFLKEYKRKISGLLGLLWLWTLARLYEAEKRRRIPTWQLEDLALLKIIKPMPSGSGISTARTEKSSAWRIGEDNWSRFYVLG